MRPAPVSAADPVRLVVGVATLAAPAALLRAAGSPDGAWARRTARALGARWSAQAVLGLAVRDRRSPEPAQPSS